MSNDPKFSPGKRVRLKLDPGRIGVITGRTRKRAGRTKWQVQFPDFANYHLESELDVVIEEQNDPLDLLRAGKLGRVSDLRGNLTYVRLNGRLANLIYSMETTNTDFYAYQFKPVLNFLDSPSGSLLIADEVGLGKTIEAGLIWTELRARFDYRRLMVLCPAMLREKWRLELRHRFGINGEILSARECLDKLSDIRDHAVYETCMIGSLQGFRPRRGWADNKDLEDSGSALARFLGENQYDEPLIDLLIIDEAHYLRNPESMTSKLGSLMRGVCNHIVLLSATPIHLKNNDLYELLHLADEDTFNQPRLFDDILKANGPLVAARELLLESNPDLEQIKEELDQAQRNSLLSGNRQLKEIFKIVHESSNLNDERVVADLRDRLERVNLLSRVVNRTRKREVTEWRVVREAIPEIVQRTPAESEFYSNVTEVVRNYCSDASADGRTALEGFLLVMPQRQMASSMPAALKGWQERAVANRQEVYQEFGDFDEEHGPGPLVRELLKHVEALGDLETLWKEDTKYQRLIDILSNYFHDHAGEKVILFSTFRGTLQYLQERLKLDGIANMILMGGGNVDKDGIIQEFRDFSGSCILLASEVASEGIDLQFCRVLINYDLPWNPMKVEQRIGRIDRIGQKAEKITIWNLFYSDTIDSRIYQRLYSRLGIFENALGGLEAILGKEVRQLTIALLSGQLTPEQEEERIEQTAKAVENLIKQESRLEEEAGNLVAHGDYILNQVRASREMSRWITADDLRYYVKEYILENYPGSQFSRLSSDSYDFEISLSPDAKFDFGEFLSKNNLHGKTRLTMSGPPIRCEFINKVATGSSRNVEKLNQFHPLIRFVGQKIKETDQPFYPVVGIRLDWPEVPDISKGIYVFTIDRWSVSGLRDIEKLKYVAVSTTEEDLLLDEQASEKLVEMAATKGIDWISASANIDCAIASELAEKCIEQSENSYESFIHQIRIENEDRADLQRKTLEKHKNRQIRTLNEVREKHVERGRQALVNATDGRIRTLKERMHIKLRDIDRHRDLKCNRNEIAMGVIKVC